MQMREYGATGAAPQFGLGRMLNNDDETQYRAQALLLKQKDAFDTAAQNAAYEQARGLEGMKQQGDTQRARIGARASTLGDRLGQQRFDAVFPWMQGQMGQIGNAMLSPVGGQSPPSPEIGVGPVWNDGQVQQQVNAARASNDRQTATNMQTMQKKMAGRGFGANSPLAQALGAGMQNQNLASNMDASRGIRWDAAEGNAKQTLASQQAREAQFASRQDEDIARRRNQLQQYSALMSALTGLV